MSKLIRKISIASLVAISSVYLTMLIDVYTLNTTAERLFVFLYFCVFSSVLLYLKGRFVGKSSRTTHLCSAVVALIVVILFQSAFLPSAQETTITLRGTGQNPAATGGEIWLTDVKIDNRSIPLNQLKMSECVGWTYSAEFDDYVYYPNAESGDNLLRFQVSARQIDLRFAASPWCGIVEFMGPQGTETMDLYSANAGEGIDYTLLTARQYSLPERLFYSLGATTVLTFLVSALWGYIQKNGCKKDVSTVHTAISGLAVSLLKERLLEAVTQLRKEFVKVVTQRVNAWKRANRKSMATAAVLIILTVLTTSAYLPQLFYECEDYFVTVTALDEKNEACLGYEMGIIPVVNGVETLDVVYTKDDAWQIFNSSMYQCGTPGSSITFRFNSANENNITYSQHLYAAKIQIDVNGQSDIIDLYSESATTGVYSLDIPATMKSPEEIAIFLLAILFAVLFTNYLMGYCFNSIEVSTAFTSVLIFIALYNHHINVEYQYNPLFILGIYACIHLYRNQGCHIQDYLKNKGMVFLSALVSLYTAFAIFGFELFLKDVFWDLSFQKWISLLNIWLITHPVILLCFEWFERQKNKKQIPNKPLEKKERLQFHLICFGIMSALMIIACIIYYPANMTSDNVDQWFQALGHYSINDAHPAIYTLFLRFCTLFSTSPISATIASSLLFAYVISSVLVFFLDKGYPRKVLLLIAGIIPILPNTIAMITCPSKNIMFAILMLWLVFLLVRIFDNPEKFFKEYTTVLQFVIVLAATYLIRHNTFVVLPVIAGIVLYITIRYFKAIKLRAITYLMASILLIQLISGPVYDYFGVVRTESNVMMPLVQPYITVIAYDVPIPDETVEYLEKILPLDEFAKRYSPYNSDIFDFSLPRRDFSNVSTAEGMKYYLQLLGQRPDIVIKTRLDGVNLFWDIFSHPEVPHGRYALGVWSPSFMDEYTDLYPQAFIPERRVDSDHFSIGEGAPEILSEYLAISCQPHFLNSLIWRNGLYLILMLIIAAVAINKRIYRVLAVIAAPFFVLCTLLLYVGWQLYQYTWFFPMSILLCAAYLHSELKKLS